MTASYSWAETPVSDRQQKMLFSRSQVQDIAAASYHTQLANLSAKGKLDTDPALLNRVRLISARLITQAIRLKPETANWPWEIHITSDDQVSAFSMAGGKLLVGSHFVKNYNLNDDELTVALAHEVGHVIAEHVREQISLAASFEQTPPNHRIGINDVINDMESDISVFLRLQPLSRLQELEADDIGIELAARAGTPPKSIKTFYDKIMSKNNGQSIFDTHGNSEQRYTFIRSMAAYAVTPYRESNRSNPHDHIPH